MASTAGREIGESPETPTASEIGPPTTYPTIAATMMTTYWLRPAAPVPRTLPISSCRGVAAVIRSSITRPDFSSATLCATQLPYVRMAMKVRMTTA